MKQIGKRTSIICALATLMSFCVCLMAFPSSVKADDGFNIYTPTPGISLTAGDSANFDLFFSGLEENGEDISLKIAQIPDGFSGYFKSGTYEVNKVHATPGAEKAPASFSLSTDAEVAEGSYDITLKGSTDSGKQSTLKLTINISELKSGESNFDVQYPDQEGVTGTVFSYSTTLINNSLTNQNYNFSCNAPEGWLVTFTSNDTQVSSLDVEAGASEGVKITVTPPDGVTADTYPISCTATSAKETLTTVLNVKILGTYNLDVTTSNGNLALDAYADKPSDITLVVTNTGNVDLENIQLTSKAGTDWKVDFDQNKIDSLAAGASQEVKAHITPGSDSITGDYVTDITASCSNKSDTVELRVTVKTPTGWGVFAVIIVLIVIGGLYLVMKKYGRR